MKNKKLGIFIITISLLLGVNFVSAGGTGTINQLIKYLTTKDEGTAISTRTSSLNFTGSGVTATNVGNDITVNIPGATGTIGGSGTTNELAYFTAPTTISSLTTATYPSLSEFSFLKGVTSAIQTQLDAKVGSVTGTANRITIGGTSTAPTVDIASNYAGQNTITTLGTIGTGVWNGTTIGSQYGGTGQNSSAWVQGDLPYISATGTWSNLAKNTTATRYLSNTGTSNNPAWAQITLSNGVTGTLGATNGGTGASTVTTGDLLYGSATNTWSKLADVATGNALISGGVGVAPSWGKIGLTTHVSGTLPVANGGTNSTSVTASRMMYSVSSSQIGSASSFTVDNTNGRFGIGGTSTFSYNATIPNNTDGGLRISMPTSSTATRFAQLQDSSGFQHFDIYKNGSLCGGGNAGCDGLNGTDGIYWNLSRNQANGSAFTNLNAGDQVYTYQKAQTVADEIGIYALGSGFDKSLYGFPNDTSALTFVYSQGKMGLTAGGTTTNIVLNTDNSVDVLSLTGTGTRMVTADSTGKLGTDILPTSGTYTPTATNVTNITSSTPNNTTYQRVGNIVNVTGSITVTTTLAVASQVDVSLPIASNIGAVTDLNGLGDGANGTGGVSLGAYITGDATNDRASIFFTSVGVGATYTIYYHFSYKVI